MTPANPFAAINVNGYGTMRGVTLALPSALVRNMLPAGLELGAQDITEPGTHPVILFFHDMFRAQMSIPTLLPNMTYREHSVGIPFSYLTGGPTAPACRGPYYYMPRLYLDNFLATLGGIVFWGFAKEMANVTVTDTSYAITSLGGGPLTSLTWKEPETGAFKPIAEYPSFEPVRQMLTQPIISKVPAGAELYFVLSDFDKEWETATVRPLETCVDVNVEYVLGYRAGRYPASRWSPGIDSSVLGSYELRAPWRLSIPYLPM